MTNEQYQAIWIAETAAWAVAIAFALWRGDRPVRVIAAIYLVGYAAIWLADRSYAAKLVIDVVALAPMLALAVRAPRAWLMWSCAFQLVTIATRVAHLIDPTIQQLAFATAVNTWSMLQLAALAWGTGAASCARRMSEAAA